MNVKYAVAFLKLTKANTTAVIASGILTITQNALAVEAMQMKRSGKVERFEMILTCEDCKHCKRCLESDRKYICTSFQRLAITGKMLKVQKIKAKMYTEEENDVQM